jgi:uncharacterized protein YndB with AHSA1/START domain
MGAVVQVNSTGFLVKHEVSVNAAPAKVYDALMGQIGSWWDPQHTYSGDSKNLAIDARPGGCFCERLQNGGGIEHMRVVYIQPGKLIRMSGALGPLQASGLAGSLTWKLTGSDGSTNLELSYSVGGYMEGGIEKMAPAVNDMLGEQLQRLKAFVETGNPTLMTTKAAQSH